MLLSHAKKGSKEETERSSRTRTQASACGSRVPREMAGCSVPRLAASQRSFRALRSASCIQQRLLFSSFRLSLCAALLLQAAVTSAEQSYIISHQIFEAEPGEGLLTGSFDISGQISPQGSELTVKSLDGSMPDFKIDTGEGVQFEGKETVFGNYKKIEEELRANNTVVGVNFHRTTTTIQKELSFKRATVCGVKPGFTHELHGPALSLIHI